MRLRRAVGQTESSGPLLAGAPKYDEFGLHHADCACARCQLGYAPTRIDRDLARRRSDTARAKAKAAVDAARIVEKKKVAAAVTAELLKGDEADTRRRMETALAPVARPATAEELAELKREFGLERKGVKR